MLEIIFILAWQFPDLMVSLYGNSVFRPRKEYEMSEANEEKHLKPPYLSYKTFLNFIERLKAQGVPTRIDRSVVGSFSGAIQRQLFSALQYLGLMNDGGWPTEKLKKLVNAEKEKPGVLKEIMSNAYPFLFGEKDNLGTMTSKMLQEKFEESGTTGETTRKSIKFFLMIAKDSGIELSQYISKPKERAPRSGNGPKTRKQKDEPPASESRSVNNNSAAPGFPDRWRLLLEKFPSFDPSWPDDIKSKWLDGFNWLREESKK